MRFCPSYVTIQTPPIATHVLGVATINSPETETVNYVDDMKHDTQLIINIL
jgi:hypothetical protein